MLPQFSKMLWVLVQSTPVIVHPKLTLLSSTGCNCASTWLNKPFKRDGKEVKALEVYIQA